ncbi:MAG: DNA topoisomerase IV subunit A, partial [Gammaproteobacteria bacterium]|nr:DNA topoisomerase IV subunit A [Gammaproteobacteria bacterium]
TTLGETVSRTRSGKSVLNVPQGAMALSPVAFTEASHVAAVTSAGRLLAFPIADVPVLSRGKGQKLINIPPKVFKAGEERVVAVAALGERNRLVVRAGGRHTTVRFRDLKNYLGSRAQRGHLLPRGLQRVDSISIE